MTEFLIYVGIGRTTIFAVGVLLVAALVKLGHVGLRRWGVVQHDVAFARVLSCVLMLYALVLPFLIYDIVHASIMDQISRQIESASTHFDGATMPEEADNLVGTLESVQTKFERRWRWSQLAGAGLLVVLLALWMWERQRSRPWLRTLRWATAIGMIVLPIVMSLQLNALESANWNSNQSFDHRSGSWVYQAINMDQSFISWHYYILPMVVGPLALWIVSHFASRNYFTG